MYLDHTFARKTFAQRIGSAKVQSEREVGQCSRRCVWWVCCVFSLHSVYRLLVTRVCCGCRWRSCTRAIRPRLHHLSLNIAPLTARTSAQLTSMYRYVLLATSLHLWTVVLFCIYGLFYYYCCCTVCTALLFSYSAIFIAASVRNKLIHSVCEERNKLAHTQDSQTNTFL